MKHLHKPLGTRISEELFEYRLAERKKLILCMVITGIAMLIEIIGGFLTNSLALISDAGHMFTHFFALAISFGAIVCANSPVCHHRTFGFYRIEVLAALLNSIFLFAASFWIIFESVKKIFSPQPILVREMFVIAIIGLITNLASVLILSKSIGKDLNIKGAFLHMITDTLSSFAIVIGAGLIYFTNFHAIDPILSACIALLILRWGWGLFIDSTNILLEAAPKGITSDDVTLALIEKFPEIEKITDLHIWTITSDMHSMTMHIKLCRRLGTAEENLLLERIKQTINDRFRIEHTTIEIE